jgi:hypothetical protein
MDTAAPNETLGLIRTCGRTRAQLCVLRRGRTLPNRSFNCAPGALFLIFSAGKPLVTMLVHLPAERDAVAGYHVLSHGFILGELVRRVTGISVPEFPDRELFAPPGMYDSFLVLPRDRSRPGPLLPGAAERR